MSAGPWSSPVVELRQYTLVRGRRDELIDLFERVFVEPQDAAGARVLGQFRDLDDADRFVWIRGFASMTARHAALTTFYDGPVWRSHREAAVATMRDSDNVLLLRPSGAGSTVLPDAGESGAWLVLIHDVRHVDVERFVALFDAFGRPALETGGATSVATFVSEPATNTFERLPARTDESVLVAMARFVDIVALDAALGTWRRSNPLREHACDDLLPAFMRSVEAVRLMPTARSATR